MPKTNRMALTPQTRIRVSTSGSVIRVQRTARRRRVGVACAIACCSGRTAITDSSTGSALGQRNVARGLHRLLPGVGVDPVEVLLDVGGRLAGGVHEQRAGDGVALVQDGGDA